MSSTTPTVPLALPPRAEMLAAFLAGDGAYDGVFFTGVKTTGIYCRPSCPARKPKPENVTFFARPDEAAQQGFRPCKRCRPLEMAGAAPAWLVGVLDEIEADPSLRLTDGDLRKRGLAPERVRRWFHATHGMTFQAWQRERRVGSALQKLGDGDDLLATGLASGWESASGFAHAVSRVAGAAPGSLRDATVVRIERLPTPLGTLLAGATETELVLLEFVDRRGIERQLKTLARHLRCTYVAGENDIVREAGRQLEQWFQGGRRQFELPLGMPGTDFQRSAWKGLLTIPYGETRSYAQQAAVIGRPSAHRAVARANGDNRLAIVVPCHRVVRSDGSLSGYGGGVWRKQRLLDHECEVSARG